MSTCQEMHGIGKASTGADVVPLSMIPPSGGSAAMIADKVALPVEISYLKNIFNNLPVAVIMLDSDGYVRYSNSKAVEFFGMPLLDELWRALIERCFKPGSHDDVFELKDGRIVKIETSPLDNKCGQVLIFSDETRSRDLKKIRDHYSRLTELGEMAASLAHQIRTPLSASLLFFSNIKKALSPSSSSYASLEKGLSGLRHIEAMIKDMLIFSKGDRKINDHLLISDLIEELNQDAVIICSDYDCEINIIDETNNIEIIVNKHAIKAAISNLIVNSAQACDEKKEKYPVGNEYKGDVKVFFRNNNLENNMFVEIIVEDNGIGISDDCIGSIFEPFFTTRSNGTGLGLAVTKSVVDAHGGLMEITSSLSKGTIIKLTF